MYNYIVSSGANVYYVDNIPSQFTVTNAAVVANPEHDWSMTLKWCSIPNRFNTISSDRSCFILVQKILLPHSTEGELLGERLDMELDADKLDGGLETVYIKPGCYLTASELAVAITKSFNEAGLPLKCDLEQDLLTIRQIFSDDDDDGGENVQYYIDVSPALAQICGFNERPIGQSSVSQSPIVARKAVQLNYPQHCLLCCDVLQKSYIVDSRDFTTQRILCHFKVPDPHKQALINVGNGVGQDFKLTHLGFDSLHFTMCDLDGRKLEIGGSEDLTWLHICMSSSATRKK